MEILQCTTYKIQQFVSGRKDFSQTEYSKSETMCKAVCSTHNNRNNLTNDNLHQNNVTSRISCSI